MLLGMAGTTLSGAGWIAFGFAALGLIYCVVTIVAFQLFFGGHVVRPPPRHEAVTMLKPLCGDEPRLEENLRTFLEQEHEGPLQMLCGYTNRDDGAAAAFESLKRTFPLGDMSAVVSARRHGPNAKVSNLINLYAEARHPIVVLSDSDMSVDASYLGHVLRGLEEERVGAVSMLYRGRGDAGFWSTLAAAGISYQFLPGAVFGAWSRLATPCMGSTIALRREVLERIGNLRSFAGHLADDYALGDAIRRDGLAVHVPAHLITHACAETSFAEVWRHEVRWGATVRGLVPFCYAGCVLTYPLALAVLGTLASQRYDVGCALVMCSLVLRIAQTIQVDRQVGARTAPLWMLPIRDCLSFGVFVASFFARRVDWRGSPLRLERRGRLVSEQEHPA